MTAPAAKQRKKPGPPRTTGPGEQVVVRLHNPLLAAIDDWRAAQAGEPTRAEALRRLAERGLASETGGKPAAAPAKPVGASAKAPAPEKTRPRRS
jgi:hypothetical protein